MTGQAMSMEMMQDTDSFEQIAHRHGHRTEHNPRRAEVLAMAGRIAADPVGKWLRKLDTTSRALGLHDLVFGGCRRDPDARTCRSGPGDGEQRNDRSAREEVPAPTVADSLARQLETVAQQDAGTLNRLIGCLAGLEEGTSVEEARTVAANYGRLTVPPERLAEVLGVAPARAEELRTLLTARCRPIGLGWTSVYEYRYFLARYLFNEQRVAGLPDSAFQSIALKAKYQALAGRQAQALWTALEALTRRQLERAEREGIQPRRPRSSVRLVKMLKCTPDIAGWLIDLLRELPCTPLEDAGHDLGRRRKKHRAAATPELRLEWDERLGRYTAHWRGEDAETVSLLQGPRVEHFVRILGTLVRLSQHRSAGVVELSGLKQELEQEVRRMTPELNPSDLEEAADRLLAAAGAEDLVNKTRQIGRRASAQHVSKGGTAYVVNAKRRLERLHKLITVLREATVLKPKIAEYVANHQRDYLRAGDIELLRPLTKADVVRALGYESSGARCTQGLSGDALASTSMGRNLERCMQHMRIELPDGRQIALESLIPGGSAVADSAEVPVAGATVKHYLKALVEGEDAQAPFSDRMLSRMLYEQYGVCAARRTVAKYREAMGIPPAAGRRGL